MRTPRTQPSLKSRVRALAFARGTRTLLLAGLLAAGLGGASALSSCASEDPTCDGVCANYFDKCSDGGSNDAETNACLEICYEKTAGITDCQGPLSSYLGCLSTADSLQCSDPFASALCQGDLGVLLDCLDSLGGGLGGRLVATGAPNGPNSGGGPPATASGNPSGAGGSGVGGAGVGGSAVGPGGVGAGPPGGNAGGFAGP